jgi:predicted MFS family arabinose efflux permease
MAGNLGLAVAPAFGGLLAAWASWRLPFAAGAALAAGATLWLVLGTSHIADDVPVHVLAAEEPHPTHPPALALVYVISAAMGFVFTGFAAFLPAITGVRVAFLPATVVVRGGIVASLVYSVGFFGQWWGGFTGSRGRLEVRYAGVIAANAVCLLVAFALQDWALMAVLIAFSFVHFSTQPLENTLIARYTSHEARGMSFAVSCALSFGMGSLGAWAGGAVADAASGRLQYVFLLLAAVAAVAAACAAALALVARRLRRAPGAPPAEEAATAAVTR